MLIAKEIYIDFADLLLENALPIQLWVYVGIIHKGQKTDLYTYGMKEFGKSEIEIIDAGVESDEGYDFLAGILHDILEEDATLNDGETIGFIEEQRIGVTESEAIYLEGNSLKLEL